MLRAFAKSGFNSGGRRFKPVAALIIFVLPALAALLVSFQVHRSGYTRLELSEAESGRKIFSAVLRDGEEVVLTWRNSLFGLDVTETFQARRGVLILDGVAFADPRGLPPPEVKPADVDDLYHTGGPFTARGLGRPFSRIVFRVGEIGNPAFRIRDRTIYLKQEVGFGGAVALTAAAPTWLEAVHSRLRSR